MKSKSYYLYLVGVQDKKEESLIKYLMNLFDTDLPVAREMVNAVKRNVRKELMITANEEFLNQISMQVIDAGGKVSKEVSQQRELIK